MRNSLFTKLIGAFVLVIAIGALVISWMASGATQSAFNLYTTRSGQAWAQQLAPVLAEYYTVNGGWQGVDAVLQSQNLIDMQGMMNPGQGRGPGAGPRAGLGMGNMDQRIILADEHRLVISDTNNELTGQVLPASQLTNGTPVMVNGNRLGTVIVSPGIIQSNTPAGQFLQSVNRSILIAVAIAGLIAVLLGGLLFLQITAPIKKLRTAAHAIASGDLSQRVDIRSKDELGELGKSFNHMAENLAQAENLRRNLVADVAHELRTPLAVMQANLEGIQDGILPLNLDQVETLHEQTLLLNRLVADLRLLSLAEAGQLKLDLQETDLSKLLAQVVEQFTAQAQKQSIHLTLAVAPDLPTVKADSGRIRQILTNLIDNAMRYTPRDGTITIQAAEVDRSVRISIADTGSGILSEDLPHVFDRFYRAEKSRARASGGSGLGLAIVRQLVEAHGGQVGVTSPVGNSDVRSYGTEIWLTLPIQ